MYCFFPTTHLHRFQELALEFLLGVITTMKIMMEYKIVHSIPDIARVCLFGTPERQRLELMRVLQQIPRLTNSKVRLAVDSAAPVLAKDVAQP